MTRTVLLALVLAATTRTAAASSHCHEVSPIVGRRHCGGFGSGWAHHWLLGFFDVDLGMAVERVAVPAFTQSGTVSSPAATAAYHSQLAPGAGPTMVAVGPRYGFGYRGSLVSLGVQVTVAWALDAPTSFTQVDGFAPITSTSGFVGDFAGLGGLHTRQGSFTVAAEVAVGARYTTLAQSLPTGYTTCDGGRAGKGCALLLSDARLVISPRLRADLWIAPLFTVGLAAGADVVGGGESIALTFAFHGNPFNGS